MPKPHRKMSASRKTALFAASFVVLILVAAAGAYAYYYQNRFVPDTIVGGVPIGGLTFDQAQKLLTDKVTKFDQATLSLNYQGKTYPLVPSQIGLTFQTDTTLAAAYQTGRSSTKVRNFASKLKALVVTHNFPLNIVPISDSGLSTLQTVTLKEIVTPATETGLSFAQGNVTVVPGKSGNQLDLAKFTNDLIAAFTKNTTSVDIDLISLSPAVSVEAAEPARLQATKILSSPWSIAINGQKNTLAPADIAAFLSVRANGANLNLTLDQTKLTAYLTALATKINTVPVDATLVTNNGIVSIGTDGTDGLSLDLTQTAAAVTGALLSPNPTSRSITGVATVVHPTLWSGNLSSLGVNQLIGTGTTDFSGSPSNRVANIKNGVSKINGQFVQPGAEFSTVGALSPIDQDHGYVPGLVIVNNQTFPADGGGLCQVSTTLFRAVLNTGLPVTARTPHSYQVSYYQRGGIGPGLDATIYDPTPDFKWKNDTGHVIYIQGIIKNKTLTFNFFGTSDGRVATITGPITLSTTDPSGDPIYVNTDTLATGVTKMIDPPVPGAKTTATYTVTRDGQVINTQVFNSSYQAMPAQYLVGTGPALAPDPAPAQ